MRECNSQPLSTYFILCIYTYLLQQNIWGVALLANDVLRFVSNGLVEGRCCIFVWFVCVGNVIWCVNEQGIMATRFRIYIWPPQPQPKPFWWYEVWQAAASHIALAAYLWCVCLYSDVYSWLWFALIRSWKSCSSHSKTN